MKKAEGSATSTLSIVLSEIVATGKISISDKTAFEEYVGNSTLNDLCNFPDNDLDDVLKESGLNSLKRAHIGNAIRAQRTTQGQEIEKQGEPQAKRRKIVTFQDCEISLVVDNLVDFFMKQTKNGRASTSYSRILGKDSVAFPLEGREPAIKLAANCFLQCLDNTGISSDRIDFPIPVCCGIPGLGKTRMIQEWQKILNQSKIPEHFFQIGILLPYYNGHKIEDMDKNLPIQASFSWRLLHRFFLEDNHIEDLVFTAWFSRRLPSNASSLKLDVALQVIQKVVNEKPIALFIGVDEYQAIEEIDSNSEKSSLIELVDTISNILVKPPFGIHLFPMLSGTDLSALSIANSSKPNTKRLPMTFLSPLETKRSIIGAGKNRQALLSLAPALRHLFFLGGLPRPEVEYCKNVTKKYPDIENLPPSSEQLNKEFESVWDSYVVPWGKFPKKEDSLSSKEILHIVAWSISGQLVDISSKPIRNLSWSRLQDSSICLLESCADNYRVVLPYSVIRRCSSFLAKEMTELAEICLIETIKGLVERVDAIVYDVPLWNLWEKFGAYFHAARINALQVIGKTIVPFWTICFGALINDCEENVTLRPVEVFATGEKFSQDIAAEIGKIGYPQWKRNWVDGNDGKGFIVINGADGEGVDIFFALKRSDVDGYVVCLDQRKRVAASYGKTSVANLLSATHIIPHCVQNPKIIRGLFNVLPWLIVVKSEIPTDTFVVCYNQTKEYHASLAFHPVSSPCININYDLQASIVLILVGKKSNEAAKAIIERRQKSKFLNVEELQLFLYTCFPNVQIRDRDEDRIVF